jgi:leucyl/phenylalanyl-tRNA--protein transferase
MPVPWIVDDWMPLPQAEQALPAGHDLAGLVAAGGAPTPTRLAEAYRKGIFPWYGDGQPVLWWSPDPRMVLDPGQFKVSRSFRKVLRRFVEDPACEIRFDHDCPAVIEACAHAARPGQRGTWIVPDMVRAYADWHREGAVHSVETWMDGERVGGLYGVLIGRAFFGESMFAHRAEASKIALAALVCWSRESGIELIDCQQVTAHLASLGARPMPQSDFLRRLRHAVASQRQGDWTYHPDLWAHLRQHALPCPDRAP